MAENTFDETSSDATPADDDRLRQKKRARRRLIGAIALALAAIIVLPLVMDREPAPSGPEIQVRIPSQDNAAPTAPSTPAATVQAPAAAAQPDPIKVEPAPKTEPPPAPANAASGAGTGTTTAAVPGPTAAIATKPTAELKADAGKKPAEPGSRPAADDAARAQAALAGEAPQPRKAAAGDNGKWIVQLGAYQGAGNVGVLMGKLKEMRVPAYTEKVNTPQGPRTRVRAGPFGSKDDAMKVQVRVRTIGVNGTVALQSTDAK